MWKLRLMKALGTLQKGPPVPGGRIYVTFLHSVCRFCSLHHFWHFRWEPGSRREKWLKTTMFVDHWRPLQKTVKITKSQATSTCHAHGLCVWVEFAPRVDEVRHLSAEIHRPHTAHTVMMLDVTLTPPRTHAHTTTQRVPTRNTAKLGREGAALRRDPGSAALRHATVRHCGALRA